MAVQLRRLLNSCGGSGTMIPRATWMSDCYLKIELALGLQSHSSSADPRQSLPFDT